TAAFLTEVGFLLGFAAFVVPGVIAMIAWFVTAPACVVERLGPIASLGRSSVLTKGFRWKILGVLLIFEIAVLVPMFLASFVVARIAGPAAVALLEYCFQMLGAALAAILAAVLYYELRAIK